MNTSAPLQTREKSRRSLHRKGPSPLVLEARLMFDGAAVDVAVHAAIAAAAPADHPAALDHPIMEATAFAPPARIAPVVPQDDAHVPAVSVDLPRTREASAPRVLAEGNAEADGGRHEIVFMESAITNWPSLTEQIRPGIEVVLLDAHADGLTQIADYLQGRSDIDAIHIVAHGESGVLDLGTTHLDTAALQTQAVATALHNIGSHLGADGDILLYGCDIARSTDGAKFVTQLATLTSADLAASDNATGSASLGGDWVLEMHTGAIAERTLDLATINTPAFLLGVPAVTSVDDSTYNEGSGAVVVDSSITVAGGTSYDGKSVRFSLTNGQTTDVLGLNSAANVNAAGAISLSGVTVFVGNGSTRDAIGTVDATENGLNGQALKINFVSTFTNSSFETTPLAGWTAINGVVNLGVTNIAGFTSPNDSTNPANAGNDDVFPSTPGTFTTTLDASQKTDGLQSLHLLSSGMTTATGYDIVHGPAVYSDAFAATAGDAIYFDWRAFAGSDAYDVFGYLLNTATGATTTVLDATGNSSSGSTNWATASASIPTSGNYRFVFVSGTYDFSGGRAAGASMYLDNVRVFGSKVNDALVTSIARQVTFQANSDAPATALTRVFTVTATSSSGGVGSDTGLINITTVNDAPTLTGAAQTLSYTENGVAIAIDGAITVVDPDLPANFSGGYLQAQITGNGSAEDQLSVLNQGVAAGQIGVSGSTVTYGGVVIGAIDAALDGTNNSALKIALNGSANTAATQALARAIAYRDTSDAPSTATRALTFTLNDGGNSGSGSALSGTRTAAINVTPVDDPTVLTLSTSAVSYTENNTSFLVDAGLTLTDVDSTTMNGAKVIIAAGFKGTEDQLMPASGTNADGITYSYDATKGVLTLSGSATLTQYQAALRAVKYNNTSENPDVSPRTITFTLGNAVALTINGTNHYYEAVTGPLSWTAAQADAGTHVFQGLTGYLATITGQTENDFIREKLTADAWIGASDDFSYINAAVGSTVYANQAASEGHFYWIAGPEKGTRISDGNTNPVTAIGSYAFWNTGEPNNSGNENYAELYSTGASPGKWNDLANTQTLSYVVEYSDSGGTSTFSKSLLLTPVRVNDAPVTSGSVTMTSIAEDATSNAGELISSLLTATDPDASLVTGIAVTTLNSSHGTWQFSLDNGASWSNVGIVTGSSALLLRTTDRMRFVPDGSNADTASFTYKAWDRSNENVSTLRAGLKTDVSVNGGITAYSTGAQSASITVTAVNDAPTLDSASPSLTSINEDATNNGGQLVSSVLGATVHDVDTGAQRGVAITSLNAGNGTWEYSTNGGSLWTAVGAVATNSALLLRDTDLIRFRPDGLNGGTASFSYKAWDRASGTQGNKVDTTTSGGVTAFSVAANTASILVTSINDAPVLTGAALTLAGISEDNASSAGQTVGSLLGATLSDVDSGAVQGIAITAQSVPGTGHWEYDNGGGWTTVGSVSPSAALLLRATDKLRFVPDLQHGGTATLTVRGWDTTTGISGGTADTTNTGGTTGFSSATASASLVVTEINDVPVFSTSASDVTYVEQDGTSQLAASLVLTDDGANLKSASVTIGSGFTEGDVLFVGFAGGLTHTYNASTGVLSLSGVASVATYQAVFRSISFSSSSEDPTVNSVTRSLQWQATDSSNAISSASTSIVTMVPTADAPLIGSAPGTWTYTEDDGTRVIAPSLALSDADDSFVSGATVVISGAGYLTDGREALGATTTGTAITLNFDAATGTLTLSGTDSVANYQRVLRSVTYTNLADYENPGNLVNSEPLDGTTNTRTVTWSVTDANSDGANGSPAYGSQTGIASTAMTIQNANETPQVSGVDSNVIHIQYTEGSAPATLEGLVNVIDDHTVGGIADAFVRVTVGLEANDELGLYSAAALSNAGWTLTGNATSGTLTRSSDGSTVISYLWSAADGDMHLTTTTGVATPGDYTSVMQLIGYRSTSDDPTSTSGSRAMIWRVTDSAGLQSAVTAAQTSIIDITAINDTAAVNIESLPGDGQIVFAEKGPVVTLAPSLTLADPDDTSLSKVTVVISGAGFIPENEFLSVPGATFGASNNWTLTDVGGSGIDGSYDWVSGTLTLSGAKTLAAYQTVLRQVTYGSIDNNPTATDAIRTISWTLTDQFGSRLTDVDGGGNDGEAGSAGATRTSTVTLTPHNDAPTLAGFGGTVDYTEGGAAATLAGASIVSDPDDSALTQATVSISAGFSAGDTLTVGSAGGLSVSYDSATGVLTLSGTASKATYGTALRSVQFASTSTDPTAVAASRTLSWQVSDANAAGDGVLTSTIGATTVNITATDNAAIIGGLPANGSVTFSEGGSGALAASALVLTDTDDSQLAGATVAISSGAAAGDLLSLTASLVGTGISIDGSSTSTNLVLTGAGSIDDYQRILQSIAFSSSSDAPTAGGSTRTLTWTTVSAFSSRLTDAAAGNNSDIGSTSAGVTSQIAITPHNDAPTIAFDDGTPLDSTDAPVFEQGGSPLFVISALNPNVAGGIAVTDVDDTRLGGASVRISDAFSANDVLSIATPAGWTHIGGLYSNGTDNITVSYNTSNGTLSLSGDASKAGYQTLLGRVQYVNASTAPTDTGAGRELTWTVTDANSAGDGARSAIGTTRLTIRDRNDAPTLLPTSGSVSYTEGALAVALPDIVVTDPDPGEIVTATLSLSSLTVGQLSVPTGAAYDLGSGVWTMTGTVADVNAALAAVQFLPGTNNDINATISAVVNDGGEDGAAAATSSISLNVTGVNDAPVLTPVGPVLGSIGENDVTNAGFQVGNFRGAITDVDSGTSPGIVITEFTSGNGVWQYSVDGGTTWLAAGAVSDANALLLRDSDLIRFVPNEQNGTTVDFTYHAWDGTGGAFGTKIDATTTGNAAPFSSGSDTAVLVVADVNDAPVLANGDTVLPSITEDQTNDPGHLISDLLAGKVTDVDSGSLQGIAITGLTAGNGSWQYSLDDGTTWLTVATASSNSALLLRNTDKVRFVPDAHNPTAVMFDYRAWDRSSGNAGDTADVAANGTTAAFSSEQNTVSLEVTAVNDAPVLIASTPAMTPLNEDGTANVGQTIASILGGHDSDVDSGALQGIAITQTIDGNGRWQYSLDGGNTWTSIAALAANTGLLLQDTDRVRFLPNSENATAGSFQFRAWDQSSGTPGNTVAIASTGNDAPFSVVLDTTTLVANGLNDAPVLAPDAPVLPTLNEDARDNAGLQVAALLGDSVTDVDVGAVQGIAVTGLNAGNGTWQYSLDNGTVWTNIDAAAPDSALLLRMTDLVRFRPDASNATAATFSYKAWDQTTGTAGGLADTTPIGVTDAWSIATNTASITVTAVNDAPINDVLPSVSGGRRGDGTLRQGGLLIADPQRWHDVDVGDPAVSFRYQWEVADDALGTNLHSIDAATASQYSVTAADIGKFVRVTVYGSDGQVETAANSAFTQVTNHVPTANQILVAQQTTESVPIKFVIPDRAFVDADAEDTLSYSASLADGSPLPSWLTFDPVTRTFSGTPGGGDVGLVNLRVTVSDQGQETANSSFTLRILSLPVNQPAVAVPTVDTALPFSPNVDQSTPVGESSRIGFLPPANAQSFDMGGRDDLFNAGLPWESTNEDLSYGLTQRDGFQISVVPSPSGELALLLAHPLIDQFDSAAELFHFTVPADTFSHTEREAIIVLTATRLDGRPIPLWLRFDARAGKFSGDPPAGFEGTIAIRVTARDNYGNEASTIFRIHEQKVTDKRLLTGRQGLSSQLATQLGQRFMQRDALHRSADRVRAAR